MHELSPFLSTVREDGVRERVRDKCRGRTNGRADIFSVACIMHSPLRALRIRPSALGDVYMYVMLYTIYSVYSSHREIERRGVARLFSKLRLCIKIQYAAMRVRFAREIKRNLIPSANGWSWKSYMRRTPNFVFSLFRHVASASLFFGVASLFAFPTDTYIQAHRHICMYTRERERKER